MPEGILRFESLRNFCEELYVPFHLAVQVCVADGDPDDGAGGGRGAGCGRAWGARLSSQELADTVVVCGEGGGRADFGGWIRRIGVAQERFAGYGGWGAGYGQDLP